MQLQNELTTELNNTKFITYTLYFTETGVRYYFVVDPKFDVLWCVDCFSAGFYDGGASGIGYIIQNNLDSRIQTNRVYLLELGYVDDTGASSYQSWIAERYPEFRILDLEASGEPTKFPTDIPTITSKGELINRIVYHHKRWLDESMPVELPPDNIKDSEEYQTQFDESEDSIKVIDVKEGEWLKMVLKRTYQPEVVYRIHQRKGGLRFVSTKDGGLTDINAKIGGDQKMITANQMEATGGYKNDVTTPEWFSGQFPKTKNSHMAFFDGHSFYIPNGHTIEPNLSRLARKAGYLAIKYVVDPVNMYIKFLPAKNVVAYGKYAEYPEPNLELLKSEMKQQWYSLQTKLDANATFWIIKSKWEMEREGARGGAAAAVVPNLEQVLIAGGGQI